MANPNEPFQNPLERKLKAVQTFIAVCFALVILIPLMIAAIRRNRASDQPTKATLASSRFAQTDESLLAHAPEELQPGNLPDPSQVVDGDGCAFFGEPTKDFVGAATNNPTFVHSQEKVVEKIQELFKSNLNPESKVECVATITMNISTTLSAKVPDGRLSKIDKVMWEYSSATSPEMTNYKHSLSQIAQVEDTIGQFKDKLKDTFEITAIMVARRSDHEYEIHTYGGAPAILKTSATDFQSKGYFRLPVKKIDSAEVQMTSEAGGFQRTVAVYEEVENYREVKKKLREFEAQVKQIKKLQVTVKKEYDQLVRRTLRDLATALDSSAAEGRETASQSKLSLPAAKEAGG